MSDGATLHTDATVVDTHNDLLMAVVSQPRDRWAAFFGERWLPQLRDGGVDVQVLPVFIDAKFQPEGALRETLRMIEAGHRIAEGNPDAVALCRTGAEIDAAVETGRIALILALEGAPGIDADVELMQTVQRLGVQIVSFVHFGRTALADGSGEDAAGSRLTRAGVEAFALLEELGVIFDVSHLGAKGVDHVLELARRPVMATHSSARALRDHHRNLTDDQLRGIAATGGVICVNFFPGFLSDGAATLDDLVDHIEHVASVAGPDAVGIGPDFIKELMDAEYPLAEQVLMEGVDGKAVLPGLEGPRGLPLVTEALLRRGFEQDQVVAVLGGNTMRLFREHLGVPLGAATAR
jgi:membrane dipeptidase